ncbi:VWD domain-containing protein [Paracoccus aminophilus]|uniref:VWFD domain-containing protein n=1 Tax=Paracoccus aminophilus JCM 7686 TaxID=1367847 RepID=S5XUI4_PARAH|nr:hypothetical protein [Paracoccus aminophilus]AGT08872.1 hypothetical protein JCM7686_1771 [Paracoccus aminophilus JCM 7686]
MTTITTTQTPLLGAANLFALPPKKDLSGLPPKGLTELIAELSKALQAIVDQLEGKGGKSGGADLPFAGAAQRNAANAAGPAAPPQTPKPIAGTARIWGDPHFIGADGDKFDIQGEAGKTYNLLSDKGFQMNGTFEKWGNDGATVVGKVGITAGSNYVQVDKSGNATVNGKELKDGERVELRDGGFALRKGNEVTVQRGEWEVKFQTLGDHIDMDIKTENAIADGVLPHGLIGQTFDGDGQARRGDEGSGAQGGGAIARADGSMSQAGDKDAVKSYEVAALWDTTFQTHNVDHGQQSVYVDQSHQSAQQVFAMMMGFSSLLNSIFSASGNLYAGTNLRSA